MTALEKMIRHAASKLPPFPRVAQKVLQLLDDPDVSTDSLVEVVQMDPSLTAEVLKAVNSPIYGLLQKVDNLAQGLTLLGNQTFSEVVFTSSSAKLLSGEQSGYELDQGDLWQHSLATAIMTQVVSDHLKYEPGSHLYTAALLHDIGKVVLSQFISTKYELILEKIEGGMHFLKAEHEVLGMDHADLGGIMAEEWGFSQNMIDLIKYHHAPDKKADDKDLAVLYVSNVACQMMGMGGGADGVADEWDQAALDLIGFNQSDLDGVMVELVMRLDQAQSVLSMAN